MTPTTICRVSRLLAVLLVACILRDGGQSVTASQETDGSSRAAAVAAAAAAGGYSGRSAGRCERITIPLCLDMKYNMTRMPNLVGHSTQAEAAMQVCHFCSDLCTGRIMDASTCCRHPQPNLSDSICCLGMFKCLFIIIIIIILSYYFCLHRSLDMCP